jgi:hypothetical protein
VTGEGLDPFELGGQLALEAIQQGADEILKTI